MASDIPACGGWRPCRRRLPLRWQSAMTLDIRKVRHIINDVAVRACVKHLEESATARVCDSARRARVMRSVQNLRNARRLWLRMRLWLRNVRRKVRACGNRVRYTAVVSSCATAHR
jgi:hypothetical protein